VTPRVLHRGRLTTTHVDAGPDLVRLQLGTTPVVLPDPLAALIRTLAFSSSLPWASASAAVTGLPTSRQFSCRLGSHCCGVYR